MSRAFWTIWQLFDTRPMSVEPHHYRLLQNPLPDEATKEVWVKCDMVAIVSTDRLDMIRSQRRRADGKREYLRIQVGPEHFDAIRRSVLAGLGLISVMLKSEQELTATSRDEKRRDN
ncbi:MAG: hypothetical protein ABI885_25295 [Gammaproteobacteria bacterium]